MTLKEGIDKLKTLLFSEQKEEVYKFETAKLNDGSTIVEWEGDLATGVIVYIVGEAGKLPAPIGVHTLEDGTTFEVVNETGAIDNVVKVGEAPKENAPEVAPNMEATPSNGTPAAQSQAPTTPKRVIKSQVEEHVFSLEIEGIEPIEVDFSSMFKSLNEKFESVKKENEELGEKLKKANDLNKEVFNVVKQMADEPIAELTESNKKFSVFDAKKAFRDDLEKLREQAQKENIN
jgi:hypothetical protein